MMVYYGWFVAGNQTLRSNPYRNWVSNKRRKLMVHRSSLRCASPQKDVDTKTQNLPCDVTTDMSPDATSNFDVKSENELSVVEVSSQTAISEIGDKSEDARSDVEIVSLDSLIVFDTGKLENVKHMALFVFDLVELIAVFSLIELILNEVPQ